jgi:hypothetical protein
MVNSYAGWVADGSPWKPAVPVDNLAKVLRGYDYTVYILGNKAHLTANPPEDHTPYSHTPWPGPQPYPYILGMDIMPGGKWDIDVLGAKIFADKQAGAPGVAGLKYMNWTDSNGNCWHDKWTPNYSRSVSSDRGHIHLSWRTDFVTNTALYDPIAPAKGYVMDIDLDGYKLPTLHKGDDDNVKGGYNYVSRAQMCLNFTKGLHLKIDGIYGKVTADAVKSLPSNSDGNSITINEWIYLYGLAKG